MILAGVKRLDDRREHKYASDYTQLGLGSVAYQKETVQEIQIQIKIRNRMAKPFTGPVEKWFQGPANDELQGLCVLSLSKKAKSKQKKRRGRRTTVTTAIPMMTLMTVMAMTT